MIYAVTTGLGWTFVFAFFAWGCFHMATRPYNAPVAPLFYVMAGVTGAMSLLNSTLLLIWLWRHSW